MIKHGGILGVALLAAVLWTGACSTTKGAATSPDGGASDGSALASLTVTFGPITVAPGQENTQCIVVPLGNAAPVHVGSIHNVLGDASHHMIIYRVSDKTPQTTPFDCQAFTEVLDPTKGSALMVSQKKDDLLSLPAGVGYTLDTNQMLRVEMHYINAGAAPLTLTATSTMTALADADYHDEAGFLFIGDPDITLAPHAAGSVGPVFFPVPAGVAGAKFFAITGHEHQFGTNVQVSASTGKSDPGTPVYDVPNWSWSEPATVVPSKPFSVPPGGGFRFTCSWNNTSAKTVNFGASATDEMCFFWAYYYPSTGSSACFHTDGIDGGADFCCPGSANCGAFLGADAGVCNSVANAAPSIPITNVASDAPAPTGGTIPDGTYFVTASQIYTGAGGAAGPTGVTYRATNRVTGTHYDAVTSASSQPVDAHASGTFATNGTNTVIQQSCPIPQTVPFTSFSSDGVGTFTIYSSGTPVQALTYTKQ